MHGEVECTSSDFPLQPTPRRAHAARTCARGAPRSMSARTGWQRMVQHSFSTALLHGRAKERRRSRAMMEACLKCAAAGGSRRCKPSPHRLAATLFACRACQTPLPCAFRRSLMLPLLGLTAYA